MRSSISAMKPHVSSLRLVAVLAPALLAAPQRSFADDVSAPAGPAAAVAARPAVTEATTTTAAPLDAYAVLRRNVEATGGAEKLAAVESVRMEGKVTLAAQGLEGTLSIVHAPPSRVLVRTVLPGIGTMEQGFDGTTGWDVNPLQGARLLNGPELDQLRQQADELSGLADVETFYPKARLVGRTTFEGHDAWELELVTRHGMEMTGYYDATTFLNVGLKAVAKSIMGDIPTTTVLRDHRAVDGIVMPFTLIQRAMGVETTIAFDSIALNPASLPPIAPPPAVQELLKERAPPVKGQG